MARRVPKDVWKAGRELVGDVRGGGPGFAELMAPRGGREVVIEIDVEGGRKVRIELRDAGRFEGGVFGARRA